LDCRRFFRRSIRVLPTTIRVNHELVPKEASFVGRGGP
jgi:hypothetical protein